MRQYSDLWALKPSVREERLSTDNARMKSVIAEITAENLELKKGLLD